LQLEIISKWFPLFPDRSIHGIEKMAGCAQDRRNALGERERRDFIGVPTEEGCEWFSTKRTRKVRGGQQGNGEAREGCSGLFLRELRGGEKYEGVSRGGSEKSEITEEERTDSKGLISSVYNFEFII
jgi:hypothetical protein